ncbi:hypothetical protein BDV96DRAFT_664784 [Lophiotrema nucula]|uniref:Uncharacterized protein n=1 Tax=Lophiotrema nucula TaxID=690887 RepID=A0A6A5YZ12_9PLEO|nr:hypothetical protein BDV96DRAFT_664784 [Lophiotrema nucula]
MAFRIVSAALLAASLCNAAVIKRHEMPPTSSCSSTVPASTVPASVEGSSAPVGYGTSSIASAVSSSSIPTSAEGSSVPAGYSTSSIALVLSSSAASTGTPASSSSVLASTTAILTLTPGACSCAASTVTVTVPASEGCSTTTVVTASTQYVTVPATPEGSTVPVSESSAPIPVSSQPPVVTLTQYTTVTPTETISIPSSSDFPTGTPATSSSVIQTPTSGVVSSSSVPVGSTGGTSLSYTIPTTAPFVNSTSTTRNEGKHSSTAASGTSSTVVPSSPTSSEATSVAPTSIISSNIPTSSAATTLPSSSLVSTSSLPGFSYGPVYSFSSVVIPPSSTGAPVATTTSATSTVVVVQPIPSPTGPIYGKRAAEGVKKMVKRDDASHSIFVPGKPASTTPVKSGSPVSQKATSSLSIRQTLQSAVSQGPKTTGTHKPSSATKSSAKPTISSHSSSKPASSTATPTANPSEGKHCPYPYPGEHCGADVTKIKSTASIAATKSGGSTKSGQKPTSTGLPLRVKFTLCCGFEVQYTRFVFTGNFLFSREFFCITVAEAVWLDVTMVTVVVERFQGWKSLASIVAMNPASFNPDGTPSRTIGGQVVILRDANPVGTVAATRDVGMNYPTNTYTTAITTILARANLTIDFVSKDVLARGFPE